MFRSMKLEGHTPDTATCNTALSALREMNDNRAASILVEKMERRGVELNTATYVHKVMAAVMCGEPQKALEAFKTMRRRNYRPRALKRLYHHLIRAFAREPDQSSQKEAMRLLKRMDGENLIPTMQT